MNLQKIMLSVKNHSQMVTTVLFYLCTILGVATL